MNIIGTCSLCGGPVGHEAIYMSVIPMAPRCQRCGATKKQPFGPVIEMEPADVQKLRGGHPMDGRFPKLNVVGEHPSAQAMRDAVTKMQADLSNRKPSRLEELVRAGLDPEHAARVVRSEELFVER